MRRQVRHKWNVTPSEAREIQVRLREEWEGEDRLGSIRTVAGLDAAFVVREPQAIKRKGHWAALRSANRAIGGAVVYKFPEMVEMERAWAVVPLSFPYVPGLLSFREVPVLLATLKKLKKMPDLLFCDGQGMAHPRRFGLACHLGVLVDKPTIGCAKSLLTGGHESLRTKAGSCAYLKEEEEVIGAALRTRDEVKPIYVSQGHRVSLETAVRMTLAVCDGLRIPRPTREADHYVSDVKRSLTV